MYRLAIYNQKGGTGKTTTAVNLAACLAERGQRVLLLDLDPQASATHWIAKKNTPDGLLPVLLEKAELLPLVTGTRAPWVSMVPTSLALSETEHLLSTQEEGMLALRKGVEQLPCLWDVILFDCPPTVSALAINALAAATRVLIPIEDSPMAFATAVYQEQIIGEVKGKMNSKLRIEGFLICRSKSAEAKRKEAIRKLRKLTKGPVFDMTIRENRALAQSPAQRLPITLSAPRSFGCRDYYRLADQLIKRFKEKH